MKSQDEESPHSKYEDEINLYDLWKTIAKRKKLIIGLFLISIVLTTITSLLMPKIYKGEAILKIPSKISKEMIISKETTTPKEIVTPKELTNIIGEINREKIKKILPKTHDHISDVKLTTLTDSVDKIPLIVEAERVDVISDAISEFVEYVNNINIIKQYLEQEKERLKLQSEELSTLLESSKEMAKNYNELIKAGKLTVIGFNPLELEKKISDLKISKLQVEQELQQFKGVEIISNPSVSDKPIKPRVKLNIAIAGVISLFAGIFLAFFTGYMEETKSS